MDRMKVLRVVMEFCFVLFSTTGTSSLSLKDHSILTCQRASTGQAIPAEFIIWLSRHWGRGGRGTHMFSWAALMALAARPMLLSTSVLVCAFSRASRWNSTVDRVPSICESCFSNLFFLFSACNAAKQGRSHVYNERTQSLTPETFAQHQLRTGHCWHLQTRDNQKEWRDSGVQVPLLRPHQAPPLKHFQCYSFLPKTGKCQRVKSPFSHSIK